jgi:hypothetical protein
LRAPRRRKEKRVLGSLQRFYSAIFPGETAIRSSVVLPEGSCYNSLRRVFVTTLDKISLSLDERGGEMRRFSQAIGGVLFVILLLFHAGCGETPESFYRSFSDAERAGAVDRGWIPASLPRGIRNIHELHKTDTGETWCAFEFGSEDTDALRKILTPVQKSTARQIRDPRRGWWSKALTGQVDFALLQASGLELYEYIPFLVAVDWNRRQAFLYRSRT